MQIALENSLRLAPPSTTFIITASIVTACTLLIAPPAYAQNSSAPSNSSLLGDKAQVTVGLGVQTTPRYLGAKDDKALLLPTFSVSRGIFFADSVRGLGAEYMTDSGLYISTALGYDFGRSEKDSSWRPGSKRLEGMGEVKGSTTLNVVVGQQITPWLSIIGEAEFPVTGQQDRGSRYRLGVEGTPWKVANDTITLSANVHAGERRYNQTYFGVTQMQSRSSRFSRFQAESGVYAYSLFADWTHEFDRHWSLFTAIQIMEIADVARNSPLVEERFGLTGMVTLYYTF